MDNNLFDIVDSSFLKLNLLLLKMAQIMFFSPSKEGTLKLKHVASDQIKNILSNHCCCFF